LKARDHALGVIDVALPEQLIVGDELKFFARDAKARRHVAHGERLESELICRLEERGVLKIEAVEKFLPEEGFLVERELDENGVDLGNVHAGAALAWTKLEIFDDWCGRGLVFRTGGENHRSRENRKYCE
jgi:hypothetical protein